MPDPPPSVGIDLGTTFSVIAHLDERGLPRTIPNAEGDPTTPSVVLFDEDSIVVGKEAVRAAALEPDRIAQYAKREMGKSTFSKAINGEFFPPEVIQSLILEKLKRDAEVKIGPFKEAVITVPAYFNEPRRKATQDAGRMAGLEVLDIINEPTAAAIAYGVEGGFLDGSGQSRRLENILIYDLGGGTFDVTVMRIDGKNYEVVATDGNVMLGGIDWDSRIVEHLAQAFEEKHGVDPREDAAGLQRLMQEAEDAKRALTARDKITVTFEHHGQGIRLPIARQQFEEMTANLVERTRFTTTNLLQQAAMNWSDISRLLLVGGSTRMPMVTEMLERESGRTVDRCLGTDEAVAHGAAIYAGLLRSAQDQTKNDVKVTNVNAHSLGVLGIENETGRKRNKVMIERNTPLPATSSAHFKTANDDQRNVSVNVIEGGDASGANSTPIGKCVIRDLPPGLAAGTPVEVTFSYGSNGRMNVHATIPQVQKEAKLDIKRESGLSDGEVNQWGKRVRSGMKPLNLDS